MEVAIEDKKEMSLQILDQRETELRTLAELGSLKITGLEDKDGYKKVREARIQIKNARVAVRKDGKNLRDGAIKFQKLVIAREDELCAIIDNAESSLEQEEERYLALKKEADEAEERKENQRIQARVDALAKFNVAHDLYSLKIMSEDEYEKFLKEAEIAWNVEQEKIAAEKAEVERMRLGQEEAARKEREEFERQKAEQVKLNSRLQSISKLGLLWDERNQIYTIQVGRESVTITIDAVRQCDDEIFNGFISKSSEDLQCERARLKKIEDDNKAELDRIHREQQAKEAQIKADREKLEAEKRKHEEEKRLEQARKEAAEKAIRDEEARIKREVKEREEREARAKEEAARQEALKPDKEKLLTLAHEIETMKFPSLQSEAAIKLAEDVATNLEAVGQFLREKIKTM